MAKHWKTIEFKRGDVTFELEIDSEDPENLVIETVTVIDSPTRQYEEDIDPDLFAEDLDDDEWARIDKLVEEA